MPSESYDALDVYFSDPRLEPLLGPGGPFEIEQITIGGVPLRSFVRAPASLIEIFKVTGAHAGRTHLVFEDERVTFAEMRQKCLSVAAELRSTFGVGAGDRVAIAMRNYPEFVMAFWAAAVLGAIVVPLNSWWAPPELAYALKDAGATAVFVDAERLERLTAAETPVEVNVITVRTPAAGRAGRVAFEELAAQLPLDEAELAATGPDDPATILYTSGTTGRPKGALGSNRATIANLMNMAFVGARSDLLSGRPAPATGQAASVAAAPLFHIGGVASIVGGALGGTKLVLMPKWDVTAALVGAERERVTTLGGIPAMARQILDFPDLAKFDFSGVRTFPLGGAPVPPDLPVRARETFGPALQILNGYGLTETTSAVVTNVGDEFAEHPDSVGRPNLTADLRVEGPDGQPLGPGSIGELCFRSPQVVNCYWNDPEATKLAFVDGWFHSGDLGYIDETGFVYVVDRLKDVVIRGGENVYCAEVEAALFEHPAVADVAVIGLPDPTLGERVCAVVVPRAGVDVNLAELRAFATGRLAAFKSPEALFLVEELPRTPTGKTAKAQLRVAAAESEGRIDRAG